MGKEGHASKAKTVSAHPHAIPISLETVHLKSLVATTAGTSSSELDLSKQAYVNAGSLVSFVGQVDDQTKSDLLNSTLLAQLAATHKVGGQANVEPHIEDWYNEYKRVLSGVGWVTQAFDFKQFTAQSASFTMDAVVLQILEAMLTQNELAVAQATLKAMKSLDSGDGRLKLFGSQSTHLNSGNFQLGIASVDGNTPVLKICCLHFQYDADVTNVLWFRFESSKTHLYTGQQSMSLNRDVYNQVRDSIIKKLGDNAKTFIESLDIDI